MRLFSRPLPVLATAVLVVNDHLFKGAGLVPTWLTGKASDVAGLFFFPILVVAFLGHTRGARMHRRDVAATVCALVAVTFAAIKVSPAACALLGRYGLTIVPDTTDLLALPSVAAAYVYMIAIFARADAAPLRRAAPSSPIGERLGLVVAAVASMATSRAPQPFTAWQLERTDGHAAGCARVDVWVSKSGKEGLGLSMVARGGSDCPVTLERATVTIGEQRFSASGATASALGSDRTVYVPFLFDNERLWNEGLRTGTIELALVAGGERVVLRVRMAHRWDDANRRMPRVAPKPMPLAVDPPDAAPSAPDAAAEGISL